jgi:hypothetical protein
LRAIVKNKAVANFDAERERIPYLLGYKRTPKNGTTIGEMFQAVAAVKVDE